jgi:uracil phosphoribosyltransferase
MPSGANAMQGVTIVDHPLVQHKLTLMRDQQRSTKAFRQLFSEVGMLLCYEVTRDLPLQMEDIETPLAKTKSPVLAGKKLVLAPIVRAGMGFLEGMLSLVPSARGAHHPDVHIWTAAVDEELNEQGYIVPGVGDVGDRMYGTK